MSYKFSNRSLRNRKRKIDDISSVSQNTMKYPTNNITKKYKKTTKIITNQDKLWKNFNTYTEPPLDKGVNKQDRIEWISPSSIRYSMMDDRCAAWLKLYYVKYGTSGSEYRSNNKLDDNLPSVRYKKDIVNMRRKECKLEKNTSLSIMQKGNLFEDKVCNDIEKRFPQDYHVICNNNSPSIELLNKTFEQMKMGTPFISQAVLYNFKNYTYGIADLLVRSDWLNKLFEKEVIFEEDMKISAPLLGSGEYHYRVIDIKYSTLQLCADGERIRNYNNTQYYKGQLTIYTAALGQLQGYTPPNAYILCKGWRYESNGTKYEGYNCFSRPGQINFNGFDKAILEKTKDSIDWVRDLKYNGHKWSCNPPSNEHLYPNMNNKYDSPYTSIKKKLANDLGELTTLWYVGPKHRKNAHLKNIYRRDNKNLTSKVLGINGMRGNVLDEVLKTNTRSKSTVRPKLIKNTDNDWGCAHYLDFFIDIESFNTGNMQSMNITNSKSIDGIIFCIGVGHENENGKWIYKSFNTDSYSVEYGNKQEFKVIDDFFTYILDRINTYSENISTKNNLDFVPRFFHWSHAEPTSFSKANNRHNNRWDDIIDTIDWIDMYKIFIDEPITIKGAYNFSLKTVANAFHKNGYINTTWSGDILDGHQVVIEITKYYNFMNQYNKLNQMDKIKHRSEYRKNILIFDNIVKYNEVDCKVLWEIVNYLRSNHFPKLKLVQE